MFNNKHVIIAMLVAPVLAVLAWFAVGKLAGEQPHSAQPGQSYPLVARSNCRYASGQCDLRNEDFRLSLTLAGSGPDRALVVQASHPLEGIVLAVEPGTGGAPEPLLRDSDDARQWRLPLVELPAEGARIRLVARAGGSSYFVEHSTAFLADYRE